MWRRFQSYALLHLSPRVVVELVYEAFHVLQDVGFFFTGTVWCSAPLALPHAHCSSGRMEPHPYVSAGKGSCLLQMLLSQDR